jgi:hypothetical protein
MSQTNGSRPVVQVEMPQPQDSQPISASETEQISDDQTAVGLSNHQSGSQLPERSPQPSATPSKTTTLLLFALVMIMAFNGCNFVLGLIPQYRRTAVAVEQEPTAVPPSVPQQPKDLGLSEAEIKRNAAIADAIKEAEKQQEQSNCAAVQYLLQDATQEMSKTGTPVEVVLLRRLELWNSNAGQMLVARSQLSGSPDDRALARSLVGDSYALTVALAAVRANQPIPQCSAALATLHDLNTAVFTNSVLARQLTAEQRLRESGLKSQQYQPNFAPLATPTAQPTQPVQPVQPTQTVAPIPTVQSTPPPSPVPLLP